MFLSTWLRNRKPSACARRGRFRPQLELLEDRAVPATLIVTTPLDVINPNDGLLSLREAIQQANASAGAESIDVPAGHYALTEGTLFITSHLTLGGAGAAVTIIDGAGLELAPIFIVTTSGDAIIAEVTIQGAVADSGSGIFNAGTLTVNASTVSGNSAQTDGGGIWNIGTLTLNNSTLSGNSADGRGGGIFNRGTLTVRDSTLTSNVASEGGGIQNGLSGILDFTGTLTVRGSTLSNNFSFSWGGGISNGGGTLTVLDTTLSGNAAGAGGAGIFGSATIFRSTIRGNSATNAFGYATYGGGIYGSVEIHNTIITENSARFGGGIAGAGRIVNSTLADNVASTDGGGVYNFGTLAVINCTLSGNVAGNSGGGIINTGELTVRNSTISGNSAIQGGGIFNSPGATVTVRDSTFSANAATELGGGIANYGELTVRDSELLGNFAVLGGDVYNAGLLFAYDSIIGDRYDA